MPHSYFTPARRRASLARSCSRPSYLTTKQALLAESDGDAQSINRLQSIRPHIAQIIGLQQYSTNHGRQQPVFHKCFYRADVARVILRTALAALILCRTGVAAGIDCRATGQGNRCECVTAVVL